ncbi:MAG: hypothetical protein O3A47_06950 [Chloroflexi bacterium]|nr:hypothetical protein [Chloroflexota bacterium]
MEPGNVVGNHTALVDGSTGAISSETITLLLRATTSTVQEQSVYTTDLLVIVNPKY